MTLDEAQEPVELRCDECDTVFLSNLGTMVHAQVTTSPDGGPGPYLHFCSPACADQWDATHGKATRHN